MDQSNPTTVPHNPTLKLSEAAQLSGASVEALRLRIKRGSLPSVEVEGSRGKPVAGVRWSDLARLYPETQPVAQQTPQQAPQPASGDQQATQQPNLAQELERERALREAAAETNSRALSVLSDRRIEGALAPVIEQLQKEARTARRDSRLVGLAAILVVGGLCWYGVQRIEQLASANQEANTRTVQALDQTTQAQAQLLAETTRRAQVEAQLAATEAEAQRAQAQLQAIALGQRIRAGIAKRIRAFR